MPIAGNSRPPPPPPCRQCHFAGAVPEKARHTYTCKFSAGAKWALAMLQHVCGVDSTHRYSCLNTNARPPTRQRTPAAGGSAGPVTSGWKPSKQATAIPTGLARRPAPNAILPAACSVSFIGLRAPRARPGARGRSVGACRAACPGAPSARCCLVRPAPLRAHCVCMPWARTRGVDGRARLFGICTA